MPTWDRRGTGQSFAKRLPCRVVAGTLLNLDVRLFGPQAVLAGRRVVAVRVPNPATAADVLAALGRAEPTLAESVRRSRLAVNHEFVDAADAVAAGDEVALIGMVSGGAV
jgi:molybdopterin converting factor small subunit